MPRHARPIPPPPRAVISLIQRVEHARVEIGGETVGAIGPGLLALVGVQPRDGPDAPARMLARLLDYRVFADAAGRMNLSLRQTGGGLLLVPQFTLAADTRAGLRPSFSTAAPPDLGQARFQALVELARQGHGEVACGRFGADMRVGLVNSGPVTFWLEV
jgi:D-tyrosyl-tRNA(Tyr) deacylase